MPLEKLKKFVEENGIKCEIVEFENPVITSGQAKKVVNGKIVKSILLIVDNNPYLCILFAEDKIDFEKLKKLLNAKEIRMAKAKEVREIIGYDIGEVPPFVENVKTIVDEKILSYDKEVFCGGGSHYSLMKISVGELVKGIKNPIVAKISGS